MSESLETHAHTHTRTHAHARTRTRTIKTIQQRYTWYLQSDICNRAS